MQMLGGELVAQYWGAFLQWWPYGEAALFVAGHMVVMGVFYCQFPARVFARPPLCRHLL
jgi:hypothetical protein